MAEDVFEKILFWLPKVLLFCLIVYMTYGGFLELRGGLRLLGGLLFSLAFVLLILLIVSFRWGQITGFFLVGVGILSVILFDVDNLDGSLKGVIVPLLIGCLFLLHYFMFRRKSV